MTIAIGFGAVDGFGLMTDSCWNFAHASGFTMVPGLRKPFAVPAVRAVAAISGSFSGDLEGLCAGIEASTVEEAAGKIFRTIERDARELHASWPVYRALNLDKDGKAPEVLICGGPNPKALRLGVVTPRTHQWIPRSDKAFIVIGAWTRAFDAIDWLKRPHPETLEGCVERAADWGRRYLNSIYQGRSLSEMESEGVNATVTYPFHGVTFSWDGTVSEYVIDQSTIKLVEPVEA